MTTNQDTFRSHMLQAFNALTRAQMQLIAAQAHSSPPTADIERAWELLWGHLRSAISLASVIRASASDPSTLGDDPSDGQVFGALTTPLITSDDPSFGPLFRAVEASTNAAHRMRRHAADAFEQLIEAGQGESDCAFTVSMVRLYAQAAQSLLETVQSELRPIEAAVIN